MPSKLRLRILWMALALLPLVSQAHHSRSAFNLDETVVVEGTVTEVGWTNPHYYLAVRSDSSGQSELWTFEGHSIPGLVRNGWRKDTLEVGSRVSVVANPNRAPSVKFGLINHVTRRDGKTFHSFHSKNAPTTMATDKAEPARSQPPQHRPAIVSFDPAAQILHHRG